MSPEYRTMRREDFQRAIETIRVRRRNLTERTTGIGTGQFDGYHGIGTMGEKTVHAVVKCYMEPDEDYHETWLGNYVADIFRGDRVTEIQTGSFQALRGKLSVFLPQYRVTVVHPVPGIKTLCWVDPETGAERSRRRSSKIGTPQMAFPELYKIRPFLQDPNLSIVILMIDMEEIKLLDGYGPDHKKHATKYDRIPVALREELVLTCPEDYRMLIPYELERFTSADFARAVRLPRPDATNALQILHEMGVVERVGKQGNSYIYEVLE